MNQYQFIRNDEDTKQYPCDICCKRFSTQSNLKQHRYIHSDERPYHCEHCPYKAKERRRLNRHQRVHDKVKCKVKKFQCDICLQHFSYARNLSLHRHAHADDWPFKCKRCSFKTKTKDNLKQHLATHDDSRNFQCNICFKRLSSKASLNVHYQSIHTDRALYKCEKCPFQAKRMDSLKQHLQSHEGVKNFQCDACLKRYACMRNLNLHYQAAHGDRPMRHNCEKCSYKTDTKGNLERHLETHNGMRNFQCDICFKRFRYKQTLGLHYQGVHGHRQISHNCEKCVFKSDTPEELQRHLGTHDDVRSFQCGVCCQWFADKVTLNLHYRAVHSDQLLFSCEKCVFKTNRKSSLNRHLQRHAGETNFQCDICFKWYRSKEDLRGHCEIVHADAMSYSCDECGYKAKTKPLLQVHIIGHTVPDISDGEKMEIFTATEQDHQPVVEVETLQCGTCSELFKIPLDSRIHQQIHSDQRYSCEKCSNEARAKDRLQSHVKVEKLPCSEAEMRLHQEIIRSEQFRTEDDHRPHTCEQCPYTARTKQRLQEHSAVHENAKNYRCDICLQQFKHSRYLKRHHRLTHRREFPYKCERCPFKTTTRNRFRRHTKTHDGVRYSKGVHNDEIMPYNCDRCPYKTKRKDTFKRHAESHEGVRNFQCDLCAKRFRSNRNLQSHRQTVHSDDMPYTCVQCEYRAKTKPLLRVHLRSHEKNVPI